MITLRKRWIPHAARIDDRRYSNRISVGKPHRWKLLMTSGSRWEGNIIEMTWDDVDWIHLARDSEQWRAHVNTVMQVGVP
jgi:hypothetical protein